MHAYLVYGECDGGGGDGFAHSRSKALYSIGCIVCIHRIYVCIHMYVKMGVDVEMHTYMHAYTV
jgi:hypothetical protein